MKAGPDKALPSTFEKPRQGWGILFRVSGRPAQKVTAQKLCFADRDSGVVSLVHCAEGLEAPAPVAHLHCLRAICTAGEEARRRRPLGSCVFPRLRRRTGQLSSRTSVGNTDATRREVADPAR